MREESSTKGEERGEWETCSVVSAWQRGKGKRGSGAAFHDGKRERGGGGSRGLLD